MRPVARSTLAAAVTDQIRESIASGRWRPGDRLPTERELGATLSVGRSTIREALGALTALGIVRRRRGGLYVNEDPPSVLSASVGSPSQQELFEARGLFEVDLAGLAAARAEEGDLQAIGVCVPPHGELPEVGEFGRLDAAFHAAVARAAHNRVVAELLDAVRGLLVHTHDASMALDSTSPPEVREAVRHSLADHERIYRAICDRQPGMARDAMDVHLRRLGQRTPAHLPGK